MTAAARSVAAVRTTLACAAVSLYVLLVGPPALLWTVISRRSGLLYGAGGFGVRLGFVLAGIRLVLEGEANMTPGAVYASNHSSNVEAPAVFLALRRYFPHVRVLYKAELRKLPVLVWVFDAAGFVPLERANRGQSWPAVDRAAEALSRGNSFFIFPEGTRSRTGELLPFKKGGFVMALEAQVPIVPVAVSGARAAMRKGSAIVRPVHVSVRIGRPIPTAGLGLADRDELIARVRGEVQKLLQEGPVWT
jgi:1-acyl-sn-glycerol-3-phosphate acyltransferase